MELIYITHGNILDLHPIAPLWSWALIVGSGYGLVRLAIDFTKLITRGGKAPKSGE